MNIQDLLYETLYVNIEKELLRIYPNDCDFVKAGKFKELYFMLLKMNSTIRDGELNIRPLGSNLMAWEIYGSSDGISFSLDLASWDEWLSLSINEAVFDYMSKEEFAARCLWNMSFFGFKDEDIKKKTDELLGNKKTLDDFVKEVIEELFDENFFLDNFYDK